MDGVELERCMSLSGDGLLLFPVVGGRRPDPFRLEPCRAERVGLMSVVLGRFWGVGEGRGAGMAR